MLREEPSGGSMRKSLVSWACWLGAIGAIGALAAAEPEPKTTRSEEALAILRKADAAIQAVSAVRYEITSTPTGAATRFVSPGQGSVVLSGWTGQFPERFRVEAKGEQGGKPYHVTGGGSGDAYFLIDHETKKAYDDIDPSVMGSYRRALFGMAMFEFVQDKPFDDELAAATVELVGRADVGGVECNELRVVYPGGQGESRWFFATSDNLPRRRIQVFKSPQGEGAIERTLSKIEVDPQLPQSLFQLQLPEGYERIDDFAP
jgi:outer membrane lipoprotein-sorting protein